MIDCVTIDARGTTGILGLFDFPSTFYFHLCCHVNAIKPSMSSSSVSSILFHFFCRHVFGLLENARSRSLSNGRYDMFYIASYNFKNSSMNF